MPYLKALDNFCFSGKHKFNCVTVHLKADNHKIKKSIGKAKKSNIALKISS